MKKTILSLFACLVLALLPTDSFAQKSIYVDRNTSSDLSGPRRGFDGIMVGVDDVTCELILTCSTNVSNLHVILTKSGVIYEETETDVVMGQTFIYYVGNYDDGYYVLTIMANGSPMAVYDVFISELEE